MCCIPLFRCPYRPVRINEFSVRILAGLIGSATLPVFYLLPKSSGAASSASFPAGSRLQSLAHYAEPVGTGEQYYGRFFLLLGIWFLVLSMDQPWC
jgi:hypothetical protein